MGCVASNRRRAARQKSEQLTEDIKHEATRRKRTVDVLVVGTESAGKENFTQQLRDSVYVLDVNSTGTQIGQCVTDTKTRYMEETYCSYKDREFRVINLASEVSITKTKWIHCLENINVIIFIVDISQYDKTEEDAAKKSHVTESMELFEELCNNMWFLEKTIILFLNNADAFQNKLKTTPFSTCFPSYKGLDALGNAADYILSRNKDLDTNKEVDKTDRNIIYCCNLLSVLNDIHNVCPVEEESEDYEVRQPGICDESVCTLCGCILWYVLYFCCTLPCCCPPPRHLR